MKTPYEVRTKFGINQMMFGKANKKSRMFYWIMLLLGMLLATLMS